MSRIDRIVDNKILQNLFIWVLLYFLFLLIIQTDKVGRDAFFILLFLIPPVYIQNLLVIPLFYRGKHILATLALLINLMAFATVATYLLTRFVTFEWRMFLNMFGAAILTLAFASALKIARDSFERREKAKEAELKLLKGQLNPHFLFNTLNNLYGLSVVKSDKLPDLMLELSDLLRYSLYETGASHVPLEKSIENIWKKGFSNTEAIQAPKVEGR